MMGDLRLLHSTVFHQIIDDLEDWATSYGLEALKMNMLSGGTGFGGIGGSSSSVSSSFSFWSDWYASNSLLFTKPQTDTWEQRKNVLAVHEQLTKEEQCESPTQWIQGEKKTSGHFYQMSRTPTQCGTVILTLNPTLWCIVQRTAMRSGHSATCHGCELQKWLCRHFDGHAVFQVRLVPFDGCLTVFWLYSTHSELCGL